jgi:hypothetical protein
MKKNVEIDDAKIVEEISKVRTIGSKEVGESPEEKAQREEELKEQKIAEAQAKAKEIAEKMVKKQFRTMFLQVYDEIQNKGKALEDVIEEIKQKKSNMTRSARDFALNFEPDRIKQWIEDENNDREKALQEHLKRKGLVAEEESK